MKISSIYYLIAGSLAFASCQVPQKKPVINEPPDLIVRDYRPQSEIYFMKRLRAEYDFNEAAGITNKDAHIKAFGTFVNDSLQNFADWELIVTDVNNERLEASSFASSNFKLDSNHLYNLMLAAPLRIDKTVDTISIDNRVEFTYTILSKQSSDDLKKQVIRIKTLEKGDTVIVSGALTHLNDNRKVDFAPLYESRRPWMFDAVLTNIAIKPH